MLSNIEKKSKLYTIKIAKLDDTFSLFLQIIKRKYRNRKKIDTLEKKY